MHIKMSVVIFGSSCAQAFNNNCYIGLSDLPTYRPNGSRSIFQRMSGPRHGKETRRRSLQRGQVQGVRHGGWEDSSSEVSSLTFQRGVRCESTERGRMRPTLQLTQISSRHSTSRRNDSTGWRKHRKLHQVSSCSVTYY